MSEQSTKSPWKHWCRPNLKSNTLHLPHLWCFVPFFGWNVSILEAQFSLLRECFSGFAVYSNFYIQQNLCGIHHQATKTSLPYLDEPSHTTQTAGKPQNHGISYLCPQLPVTPVSWHFLSPVSHDHKKPTACLTCYILQTLGSYVTDISLTWVQELKSVPSYINFLL